MPVWRTPLRASVSTWALHPLIGTCAPGRPGDAAARLMPHRDGTLDLLDVPAQLAARGYRTMELCHFHLPSRASAYLEALREAREAAGVELWSLLIDDGDLTHPEQGDRDRAWIKGWIETAGALGATCVRVIAGQQPATDENLARAAAQFRPLLAAAAAQGIHVLTENWYPLLSQPAAVVALLTALDGAVGLNFDFDNWSGPHKYDWLAQIAPFAEGCHAKCRYENGIPDREDYARTLAIVKGAEFSGPLSLVHGEPGGVWESLDEQRALLRV